MARAVIINGQSCGNVGGDKQSSSESTRIALDDQRRKELIVEYLQEHGKAKKDEIRKLLWNSFADELTDKQKTNKVGNLLAALRRENIICADSANQQKSSWILVE